ncbi:MAG: D-glycero-beta-D-manno-heptose-7-phosphate kinase, partial [Deltaproteobacteria bacterium CG_4_10_14_3_um_filter_60_8]
MNSLRQAVAGFPRARILVIGDIIVDHFIWGSVSRISPEAPVPVVNVTRENLLLGGAANVLHNLYAMGAQATLCGTVG